MTTFRPYITLAALTIAAGLAGCGGKAYLYEPVDSGTFLARAERQSVGPIHVATAVPGREETERIFGIDLYDQDIQPVWLQVENAGNTLARYAPVSTDPDYFSPLEVAYVNRGGYSDDARDAMDERFNNLAMPRYVNPGETRSGFVFTHADPGAKGINVDVFSGGDTHSFTFLLRVPGFTPDYAKLDLDNLYSGEEVVLHDMDALGEAIRNLPCCSTDRRGDAPGEPLNIVLIGQSQNAELLRALLRSGWRETSVEKAEGQAPRFLFGREQDAIFRHHTVGGDGFYELRLWRAPFDSGTERVWVGQARHFYSWIGSVTRLDADVDNARNFAAQKFLYGQTVRSTAWIEGEEVVPVTSFWDALIGSNWFSDGYRIVLWLSAEPVSFFEIDSKKWDDPPRWAQR